MRSGATSIVMVTLAAWALSGCRGQEAKPLPPVQIADIYGPGAVVNDLRLATLDGARVISQVPAASAEDGARVTVEATDAALKEIVTRGCTGEHHCTVRIHVPKESVDSRQE